MNYHLPVRMVRAATAAALLASIAVTACVPLRIRHRRRTPIRAGASPSSCLIRRAAPPTSSARLLANKLQESWKQTVLVENKSGGGGVVGNDYVAKAQPDGYTVLIAITQIIQAPSLVAKAALRRLQGSRAGHPGRAVDHRSGGPRAAADQVRQGTDRSRQGEPRQALRHLRQRHDVPSLRRTAQEGRRCRHDPCSLSRLGSAARTTCSPTR